MKVLVPIDAADENNGCTAVFPGYHQSGYLSARDGQYYELPLSAIDEAIGVKLVLAPAGSRHSVGIRSSPEALAVAIPSASQTTTTSTRPGNADKLHMTDALKS